MERVTGIGGVFFKARIRNASPPGTRSIWAFPANGGCADFTWRENDHPDQIGRTLGAISPKGSGNFGGSKSPLMINYRVANLERMLTQLRGAGVPIEKVEDYDYGRFAWIMDPEGNRTELWEPKEKS